MCDLIVLWSRETEHPDKAGSTYVTFITVKRKYGSTKVGSKGGIRKTLFVRVEGEQVHSTNISVVFKLVLNLK